MIFKQTDAILTGRKVMTRRAKKEGEWGYSAPGSDVIEYVYTVNPNSDSTRIKWAVGRTYAIVPKRGAPGLLMSSTGGRVIYDPVAHLKHLDKQEYAMDTDYTVRQAVKELVNTHGYIPLRIRITALRCERLGDITEADAIAEGVESVEAYKALWISINGKWDAETRVWVISFEVVQ